LGKRTEVEAEAEDKFYASLEQPTEVNSGPCKRRLNSCQRQQLSRGQFLGIFCREKQAESGPKYLSQPGRTQVVPAAEVQVVHG
jgi:hypothetical protein